jgi:hypothetical protein
MLRQLVREVEAAVEHKLATDPVELLVCFDGTGVDESRLAAELSAELEGSKALARRLIPVDGGEYYELKNAGARKAIGDVIVFLDSDVIPEPGWLARLIEPFADEDVGVVAGNSYLDPQGFYGKTFALAWQPGYIEPCRGCSSSGRISASGTFTIDRWVSTSKRRMDSISSPKNSMRSGLALSAPNTSRIPPRIENSPTAPTGSSRI